MLHVISIPNPMEMIRRLAKAKDLWAIVEQGVVSLGSFLLTIVLARALVPEEYGLFAVLLSALLALNILPTWIIGYPVMVRGSIADPQSFGQLVTLAIVSAAVMSCALAVILAALTLFLSGDAGLAVLVAMSTIGWQVMVVARSAYAATGDFRSAIPGSALAFIGQAAAVLVLFGTNELSLHTAFATMAVAMWMGVGVHIAKLTLPSLPRSGVRLDIVDFWHVGGWALLGALVGSLVFYSPTWSLAHFEGTQEVANYQAAVNLLGATHPLLLTLGSVVVPTVAVTLATRSQSDALIAGLRRSVPFGGLVATYLVILMLFPNLILGYIYGSDSTYGELATVVRVMSCAYAFFFATNTMVAIMNGMQRQKQATATQASAGLMSVAASLALVPLYGTTGGGIALLAAFITSSVVGAANLLALDRLTAPVSSAIAIAQTRERSR